MSDLRGPHESCDCAVLAALSNLAIRADLAVCTGHETCSTCVNRADLATCEIA